MAGYGRVQRRTKDPSAYYYGMWKALSYLILLSIWCIPYIVSADEHEGIIDLGITAEYFLKGEVPRGWTLRKNIFRPETKRARAAWVREDGIAAVKLHSDSALTFLEKKVDIDITKYSFVSWKWKVDNILPGIDERTLAGDDHPIRLFFVFRPDESEHSFWFRFKRFLFLDRIHGHPVGGRFMEYLWSSSLPPGEIIPDPGKPKQKLMVIEGGREKLGEWLSYRRNLYKDFRMLYGEEPNNLIFIGILNDTDATGKEAVSYIADLFFHATEIP